ncbi:hypothetical protein QP028_01185 [Corynebacterium suedekumii]|nr:hypothetical protein QP028_01185 [Corynebacterium suedekumii]
MLFSSLTTRRAVGLWCVAAALGSIVQVAFFPLVFEWQDLDALPESVVMDRTYYLLFGLIGERCRCCCSRGRCCAGRRHRGGRITAWSSPAWPPRSVGPRQCSPW